MYVCMFKLRALAIKTTLDKHIYKYRYRRTTRMEKFRDDDDDVSSYSLSEYLNVYFFGRARSDRETQNRAGKSHARKARDRKIIISLARYIVAEL